MSDEAREWCKHVQSDKTNKQLHRNFLPNFNLHDHVFTKNSSLKISFLPTHPHLVHYLKCKSIRNLCATLVRWHEVIITEWTNIFAKLIFLTFSIWFSYKTGLWKVIQVSLYGILRSVILNDLMWVINRWLI